MSTIRASCQYELNNSANGTGQLHRDCSIFLPCQPLLRTEKQKLPGIPRCPRDALDHGLLFLRSLDQRC